MQEIERYSEKTIERLFDYFGKAAQPYREKIYFKPCFKGEEELRAIEQERYEYLISYLNDEALVTVLHLAVTQYLYPLVHHMIKELTGSGVTLKLALEICAETEMWSYSQLKGGYELLKKYLQREKKTENFLYQEFYADERLVLYLSGDDGISEEIAGIAELYFPEDMKYGYYAIDAYVQKVDRAFLECKNKREYFIQISGEEGRGKRSVLKQLAIKQSNGFIFVNTNRLKKQKKDILHKYITLIKREAVFYGFGICYYHFSAENMQELESLLTTIKADDIPLTYPVCLCTNEKEELIPNTSYSIYKINIPVCNRQERIEIWRSFCDEYQMDFDGEKYGVKYCLNPGDIKKIFEALKIIYSDLKSEEEKDSIIAKLCTEVRNTPGKGSIHQVSSEYTMEDLKLEEKQKETLKNICAYIRQSHLVYDIWNMESRFAYGKGVTALLFGSPGTGKTMAAHVLSNELKMPLYRVDLSQVVDKYIGETEKRLEEIFTYAQKSNVILFFDEADSIFGKRMEVKDSKDKYANTEVSFILQRIEEYDGIVLLATNFRNNIDDAFMRRMKYVVEFKMPDESTRKEIWESGFSKEIPLEDIDFDYLAEKIELSGGYIKNIILNAVFQAAKEGNVVTMKHVINSTRNEYMKLGKVVGPQDFERYAYYF